MKSPFIVASSVTLLSFIFLNLFVGVPGPPDVELKRKVREKDKVTLFFSEVGVDKAHLYWRKAETTGVPWQKLPPKERIESPCRNYHLLKFEVEDVGVSALQVKFVEERKTGKSYESEELKIPNGWPALPDHLEMGLYGKFLAFCPLDAMRNIHLKYPHGLSGYELQRFSEELALWNRAVNSLDNDGKLAFFHDLPKMKAGEKLPNTAGTNFFSYLEKVRKRFVERLKYPYHRNENHHAVLNLPMRPRKLMRVAWLIFGRDDVSRFLEQDELKERANGGWRRRPRSRDKVVGQLRKRALLKMLQQAIPQDLGANARLSL